MTRDEFVLDYYEPVPMGEAPLAYLTGRIHAVTLFPPGSLRLGVVSVFAGAGAPNTYLALALYRIENPWSYPKPPPQGGSGTVTLQLVKSSPLISVGAAARTHWILDQEIVLDPRAATYAIAWVAHGNPIEIYGAADTSALIPLFATTSVVPPSFPETWGYSHTAITNSQCPGIRLQSYRAFHLQGH